MVRVRPAWHLAMVVALTVATAACGGGTSSGSKRSSTPTRAAVSTTVAPSTVAPTAATPCRGAAAPETYQHVVVVVLENRTWSDVGGPGFGAMPYLAGLARSCAYYPQWTETNRQQDSLTQYIGLTSGVDNPRTVDDCEPSASCSSTDDNIFRQVRQAGDTARSYVEDATQACSVGSNAAKHIPALYYRGTYTDASGSHRDSDFCATEVRPFTELDPDHLPTFSMITPNLCDDGHDCANATVDSWLREHLGAILAGDTFRAGSTAVFVLWDEDRPVPNLIVAPSAQPGPRAGAASHAAALKTIELMLGLPVLSQGQLPAAGDLRASAPL